MYAGRRHVSPPSHPARPARTPAHNTARPVSAHSHPCSCCLHRPKTYLLVVPCVRPVADGERRALVAAAQANLGARHELVRSLLLLLAVRVHWRRRHAERRRASSRRPAGRQGRPGGWPERQGRSCADKSHCRWERGGGAVVRKRGAKGEEDGERWDNKGAQRAMTEASGGSTGRERCGLKRNGAG